MNKRRIEYLDVYRALAILAVLLIHTTSDAVGTLSKDSSLYPLYMGLNALPQFAVPAFLFLSALVLFYNYDDSGEINWRAFYRRRAQTIAIPYLIWSLFYFLLVTGIAELGSVAAWLVFFRGLLNGGNYTHLYFIVLILQFYLLFPLFLRFTRIRLVREHLVTTGIVLQTAFYLGNYYFFHMPKVGTFAGSYLLFFFLGAYAGIRLRSPEARLQSLRPAPIAAAVLILGAGYVTQLWLQVFHPRWIPQPWLSWINYITDYGYSAVCCLALLPVSAWLLAAGGPRIRAALLSLGAASFGIYFAHPLVLYIWRDSVLTGAPLRYHILTWVGGAAALLIAWLFTTLVRKSRMGALITGK